MADFDTVEETGPVPDAETMLTPLTKIGVTPRTQMVRKLADIVVLPPGRLSYNERSLVADILVHVIDKVDVELRVEVAERVAHVTEIPPALVRRLLLDDPLVAEKLLDTVAALPEALLIEAARHGEMPHRLAIAARHDLASSVVDALLEVDEIEVMKTVLRREDCTLSPHAVNKLVALSATREELHKYLLRRRELEPAHGFMMFWWVDAERRRRILSRFALDRRVIQDALSDLFPKVFRIDKPDMLVKEILLLTERRHRPRGANGEQVSMGVVLRTLATARKYPAQEIIDAVGMIAGISRELAARILRDPGGEPFAVLCKSLSIARDEFFALIDEAGDAGESSPEHAEYLLAVFDTMARDFARTILRYWDWDSNPRIAEITHLLGINDGDADASSVF